MRMVDEDNDKETFTHGGARDGSGRKMTEWTPEQSEMISRLSEIQCTQQEIAHVMGVSLDTIRRRAKEIMDTGKSQGRVKLRRAQWRNALDENNVTMQIWLGKNMLGQTDQPQSEETTLILPWEE